MIFPEVAKTTHFDPDTKTNASAWIHRSPQLAMDFVLVCVVLCFVLFFVFSPCFVWFFFYVFVFFWFFFLVVDYISHGILFHVDSVMFFSFFLFSECVSMHDH